MHPQLIGRASRIEMLDKLITYMKSKADVWFTTSDELARYWQNQDLEFEFIPNPNTEILFPQGNVNLVVKG